MKNDQIKIQEYIETANTYQLYELLEHIRKIRKNKNPGEGYGYSKMVLTGDLDFHDYGKGFLDFRIRHVFQAQSSKHFIRIFIATIDDGDMGAWKEVESKEEAIKFIDNFAETFLQHLEVFPTLLELNLQLCNDGIWIDYE